MLGFNIDLDLSIYFDDLRKFCCVFVDISKCKKVGDVEEHIKCLFRLDDDVCLVHEKFLLPKHEDSQVLRQCGTIKVQICDFIDSKNDNKEEENCPSNNLALNLIQTEKTVDLSCKPRQRLKSNLNKSHCKASGMSSCYVESNEIKKLNEYFCTDTYSKSHSKDKHKRKKKRNNFESFDEDYIKGTDSDIIDMSVNKVKKTSHDNCFLPAEDCISNQYSINKELNYEGQNETSNKKIKKRKIQPNFPCEEFGISNAVESLASDEYVSKKVKIKPRKNCSNNKYLTQELSHAQETFCKSEDDLDNNRNKAKNLAKTFKSRKDWENLQSEVKELDQIQNDCSSNMKYMNYNHLESKCDSEKHLNRKKKLYQSQIDELLANKTNFNSTTDFSENAEDINSNYTVGMGENKDVHNSSSYDNVVYHNGEQTSRSYEQSVQSRSEMFNTKIKRKRVRRQKKKKPSLYLQAVGPVLQSLVAQNIAKKSSTPWSSTAKHIYFEDKDCNEKTMVDPTISSSLETTMQGLFGTNSINTSQEFASKECPTWQKELLKLASATKPIVFQRSCMPEMNLHQTSPHSEDDSIASHSPDNTNQNVPCTTPCISTSSENVTNDHVNSCSVKENNNNAENYCAQEATIPTAKLEDSINPFSIDLQNIKLAKYPVVDKVVADDLILFQMLKLNENHEPDVSKFILAKVKCLINFPDKLLLQIIDGCEECELSKRADTNSEENIIELSWKDLIEPRLFYP